MRLFRSKKNDAIIQLLNSTKRDFEFDSESVKNRVMMALVARHLTKEDKQLLTFHPKTWPKYVFTLALAIVLMISTSAISFASSKATPGDVLFPVQKLQNKFVLSLPLPQTKKEEIRTEIVAKRLKELDAIQNHPQPDTFKLVAIVRESQRSIDEAVSHLPVESVATVTNPDAPQTVPTEPAIDVSRSPKLDHIVTKLEDLSKQHEDKMELIKLQVEDKVVKDKIDKSVISIKSNRSKLQNARKKKTNDDKDDVQAQTSDPKEDGVKVNPESNNVPMPDTEQEADTKTDPVKDGTKIDPDKSEPKPTNNINQGRTFRNRSGSRNDTNIIQEPPAVNPDQSTTNN